MTTRRRTSGVELAPFVPREAGMAPVHTLPQQDGPVSDSASKLASKNTTEPAIPAGYGIGDLLGGRPDPDLDLVPLNVRVPRYLSEALRAQANLSRGRQQEMVAAMLRGGLDAALVEMARKKAQG